jgi:hypothetical protein
LLCDTPMMGASQTCQWAFIVKNYMSLFCSSKRRRGARDRQSASRSPVVVRFQTRDGLQALQIDVRRPVRGLSHDRRVHVEALHLTDDHGATDIARPRDQILGLHHGHSICTRSSRTHGVPRGRLEGEAVSPDRSNSDRDGVALMFVCFHCVKAFSSTGARKRASTTVTNSAASAPSLSNSTSEDDNATVLCSRNESECLLGNEARGVSPFCYCARSPNDKCGKLQ